jgi:hypothetical protein
MQGLWCGNAGAGVGRGKGGEMRAKLDGQRGSYSAGDGAH